MNLWWWWCSPWDSEAPDEVTSEMCDWFRVICCCCVRVENFLRNESCGMKSLSLCFACKCFSMSWLYSLSCSFFRVVVLPLINFVGVFTTMFSLLMLSLNVDDSFSFIVLGWWCCDIFGGRLDSVVTAAAAAANGGVSVRRRASAVALIRRMNAIAVEISNTKMFPRFFRFHSFSIHIYIFLFCLYYIFFYILFLIFIN